MSERGVFATSFLYDVRLREVLKPLLAKMCRQEKVNDHGAWFSGLMHGSWGGEEAWMMETFVEDNVLDALPESHGRFEIVVMPESSESTIVLSIYNRILKKSSLRPDQGVARMQPPTVLGSEPEDAK